jgi:DNA-binding transcriptional LysR family regulator
MPPMHPLHLASLDLNLLVALDALLEERNVTRAAERTGVTQSAMSHALARIRMLIGDPLLVRGKSGMVATARAEALTLPIRRALEGIVVALESPTPFEPKTAHLSVRIATSDYGELVLLPKIVRRLEREAPNIDLRLFPQSSDSVGPLVEGAVDLIITPVRPDDGAHGVLARKLFDESFVCIVRRTAGSPGACRRSWRDAASPRRRRRTRRRAHRPPWPPIHRARRPTRPRGSRVKGTGSCLSLADSRRVKVVEGVPRGDPARAIERNACAKRSRR